MITDKETNFVYLSNLLEKKCPNEFRQLKNKFEYIGINYGILPNTNDIWVVDFMPIQVQKNKFVQYKYEPDYLKTMKGEKSKSDATKICDEIGIVPNRVGINLDGGNVVKHKNKVIITTKVFKGNPNYPETSLIAEIKNQLAVDHIIVIPQEPKDSIGHADAMVRFVDENTVLINDYPKNKIYEDFGYALRSSLSNAGLHYELIQYNSWKNEKESDASGCYINFLEVVNYIFYPIYGVLDDHVALAQLQNVFKDREIFDVDCSALAKNGGVLNCATWNILKD